MKSYTITLIIFLIFIGCQQNKSLPVTASYESFRSQYHFTPAAGWMNDPNGMVYYEGEYHLFYQHYPDSTVWGPMHWGHAVSKDMIHWEHLPIALYPDSLGYIFSGSAVIDWKNTSGLGTTEHPPMVAIFTYHDPEGYPAGRNDFQTQGIAYSVDKGRTWTKYEHNPVLPNPGIIDFRDPKVSWNEVSNQWVMTLAVKDHIEFYGSPDLKKWNKLSEFGNMIGAHGGVWECPDLFPLKNDQAETKWVLFVSINPGGPQGGSATQYFVGDFDGKKFQPQDTVTRWIDYGADNYAGVTWSDIPANDGRRLFIGWMSNWQYANVVPTQAWRSATTLPREITLLKKENHYELKFKPVAEVEKIQSEPAHVSNIAKLDHPLSLITFDLKEDEQTFIVNLANEINEYITISLKNGILTVDRRKSGITNFSDVFAAVHKMDMHDIDVKKVSLYVDLASIEIFVNDGERVMTEIVFPTKSYNPVNWHAWNSKALDRAKHEQKLLVISIGYSSCHWCHVMEKETFSDTEVAKLMNSNFVSIKVDKEERPDVDMTYMKAANLILGGGGWPLNIIALPDGRPLYVSTYLPKEKWMNMLKGVINAYEKDHSNLINYADRLAKGIKDEYSIINTDFNDTTFLVKDYRKACLDVVAKIDSKLGGIKDNAEKFPMPSVITMLMDYALIHNDVEIQAIIQTWLLKMAHGGIVDQLGGGFSRYSTDSAWKIPHFEKMLYDNAQLLSVYSNGYRIFKDEEFRKVAEMISSFLETELSDISGGYYSSIDSESGAGEGVYYTWKFTEFEEIVGKDEILIDFYGVSTNGNFEGRNVLTRTVDLNELAKKYNQPVEVVKQKITDASEKLLKHRQTREHPDKDDKIITSWNALLITGYLDAYEALGDDAYLDKAKRTAEFIWKNQNVDGQIYRVFKNGKTLKTGLLDDYANVILAFIKLYENTFDIVWLNRAIEVMEKVEVNFKLDYSSLYYYSPKIESQLVAENLEVLDDVMASSNSQLALAKFYLGKITGETSLVNQSKEMLITLKSKMMTSPLFYSNWIRLFGAFTHQFYEVAIVGDSCHEISKEFLSTYQPYKIMLGGKTDDALTILNNKLVPNKTLIYVCSDGYCKYPVNKVTDAFALINVKIK